MATTLFNPKWVQSPDGLFHVALLPFREYSTATAYTRRLLPCKLMTSRGVSFVTVAAPPFSGIRPTDGTSHEQVVNLLEQMFVGGYYLPRWRFDTDELPLQDHHLVFLAPGELCYRFAIPYKAKTSNLGAFAQLDFERVSARTFYDDQPEGTGAAAYLFSDAQYDFLSAGYVAMGISYPQPRMMMGVKCEPEWHTNSLINIGIPWNVANNNIPLAITPFDPTGPFSTITPFPMLDGEECETVMDPGAYPVELVTNNDKFANGRIIPGLDGVMAMFPYWMGSLSRVHHNGGSTQVDAFNTVMAYAVNTIAGAIEDKSGVRIYYHKMLNNASNFIRSEHGTVAADNLLLAAAAARIWDWLYPNIQTVFSRLQDRGLLATKAGPDYRNSSLVGNYLVQDDIDGVYVVDYDQSINHRMLPPCRYVYWYSNYHPTSVFRPVEPIPQERIYDGNHVVNLYTSASSEIYPAQLAGDNFIPTN